MLYIYLTVLYHHGNLHVTEEAYAGGRGIPLSQRSFLLLLILKDRGTSVPGVRILRHPSPKRPQSTKRR